jgi:hypothetical protein
MAGKLLSIYIAKAAGEPMQAVDRAELVSGKVLRDRTRPSVLAGFAHRAGLRAGIVRGGSIETGCSLTVEAEKD